jgi:signal transduction histidine kinase
MEPPNRMDKVHCLIVDDVPENLLAMEALLREEDVVVLKASSGTQALELLLLHDVALALIDVNMPEMDGFELAELMRGSERTKHVPIIFITAGSREPTRVFRGYETGAADFLFKPVDPVILRHKAEIFFQLYRQRLELERALRMRDDILSIVSHDLRNPLNVVAISTTIIRQLAKLQDNAEIQKHCQMLQRAVDGMQRIIGDLLDMVSIRAGRLSVKLERYNFVDLVNEALLAHQLSAQEKCIVLQSEIPEAPIELLCDRHRILQVLWNLIGNAVKFCDAGAVVNVRVERGEKMVCASVTDDGPGIQPDDLNNIFEAYWSGKLYEKKGTGLGLYISKAIVEAHQGRIDVDSRPRVATTFKIELPLARTPVEMAAHVS